MDEHRRLPGALLIAALVAGGCSTAAGPTHTVRLAAPSLDSTTLTDAEHRLAIGDRLSVQFPYRPEFTRDVMLRPDGKVSLPLIGTLAAMGRTPEELEAEIRARYRAINYDPTRRNEAKVYRLGIGDRLQVRFRVAQQLDDSAVVRPDGRISLPLVQSIVAEGKTPEQLAAELEALYAPQVKSPELVVLVRRFGSERAFVGAEQVRSGERDLDEAVVLVTAYAPRLVYVTGEVKTPGFVPYQPSFSALEAIMAAGGPQRTGSLRNVVVLSRARGTDSTATATFVDLGGDVRGAARADVPLRAFDIVVVPMSGIAKVNQAIEQYFYQLVPAARNLNFTFFYSLRGAALP